MATIPVNATTNKISDNGIYRLPRPWEVAPATPITLSTDGKKIKVSKDHKTIIMLKGAGNVTFTSGTTLAGVRDKVVTSTADGVFLAIESAPVADGEGLITVKGASTISMIVMEVR